jgi:hypothetical protein
VVYTADHPELSVDTGEGRTYDGGQDAGTSNDAAGRSVWETVISRIEIVQQKTIRAAFTAAWMETLDSWQTQAFN